MKLAKRTELHVLAPSPEQLLRLAFRELIEAESIVARLQTIVADQGRALAKERGAAFIRPEHLRREFGE